MDDQVRTNGWATTTVREIASLVRGITYNKEQASKISSSDFKPVLRANNINGALNFDDLVFVPQHLINSEQIIRAGDIIFAMSSGSKHLVGKSARARCDFDGSYGAFCGLLRAHKYMDKDFLYYIFQNNKFRRLISEVAKGSNINNLKREHILDFEIVLPPLPEQHRIVAKIEELFSELDKGIENLRIAQSQLKVYRQALLKHAFEGKLTAQWRAERNVTPAKAGAQPFNDMDSRLPPAFARVTGNDEVGGGNDKPLETAEALLKRIQQERAQRYQQQLADWEKSPSAPSQALPLKQRGKPTSTAPIPPLEKGGRGGISKPKPPKSLPLLTAEELAELPELPEGWAWVKLGAVVETNVGFAFKSSEFSPNGIRLLRGENIEPRQLRWVDTRFWPSESMGQFSDLLVNPGEIIIAMDRPVISSGLKVARVKQSDVPCLLVQRVARIKEQQNICTSYIFSVIDQNRFINHCLGNQTGTQLPHISEAQIRAYPIPLCSYEEQIKISEELDSRISEVDQLDQTITTALQQAEALRQSILKKAFSGQLVPQDPNDEPASALLTRIKAERADTALKTKRKTT